MRFEAQLNKFNFHPDTTKLPACSIEFVVSDSFNMDNNLQVIGLAPANPGANEEKNSEIEWTDIYLNNTFHSSVAFVVHHCNESRSTKSNESQQLCKSIKSRNASFGRKYETAHAKTAS